MKTKIHEQLTKPYVVVFVMIVAPLLNYFDRNYSYFFGLAIALLILWSSNYKWSLFSFTKKVSKTTIVRAFIYAVVILILFIPFDLLVDFYFGSANLSSLEGIKHNFISYIITLIIVWVFAAFGEEFLFRGYYLKWLSALLGDTKKAWMISMAILAIYFGVSHYYQGMSGVLGIIPLSFVYSLIYYKNRDNLSLLVFMHGFHDTIGLTFIYLDIENPISEWLLSFF